MVTRRSARLAMVSVASAARVLLPRVVVRLPAGTVFTKVPVRVADGVPRTTTETWQVLNAGICVPTGMVIVPRPAVAVGLPPAQVSAAAGVV